MILIQVNYFIGGVNPRYACILGGGMCRTGFGLYGSSKYFISLIITMSTPL